MKPHIDVAKALKPIFTTPEGKAFRDSIGFGPASLVVTCGADDHVADVLGRVREGKPPVLVAFLEASKLRLIIVEPDHERVGGAQVVSRRVTISMLFHAAQHTGETRFRLGEWDADQVASLPEQHAVPA